jgi:hypothetical protein
LGGGIESRVGDEVEGEAGLERIFGGGEEGAVYAAGFFYGGVEAWSGVAEEDAAADVDQVDRLGAGEPVEAGGGVGMRGGIRGADGGVRGREGSGVRGGGSGAMGGVYRGRSSGAMGDVCRGRRSGAMGDVPAVGKEGSKKEGDKEEVDVGRWQRFSINVERINVSEMLIVY